MAAKVILTEAPEQFDKLVKQFIKTRDSCEHGYPAEVGVAKNHTVTKCSHNGYDHCMGPSSLCLFDFCPIIQEGL